MAEVKMFPAVRYSFVLFSRLVDLLPRKSRPDESNLQNLSN